MLHYGSKPTKTREVCNENLFRQDVIRGREEFKKFVEDTVRGMIDLENKRNRDRSSSLEVFCRLDVAVSQPEAGGSFHYYVNELERSLTVGLFRRTATADVWTMLHSAVDLIPTYMRNSRALNMLR
jgi:hypothetical protein